MNIRFAHGKAAEHRVMSELFLRGYVPSMVSWVRGIDLVLADGTKIQVKGTLDKTIKFPPVKGATHQREKVDFFITWQLGTDKFWIIPANTVPNVSTVRISERRFSAYIGAWNLLPGPTQRERLF